MIVDGKILVGTGDERCCLLPEMSNRHGLIAGATGTGKTTTLKVLAEGFSLQGVPVFLADIKGDLTSMAEPGVASDTLAVRLAKLGIHEFAYQSFPVQCWDVFGIGGTPVRTTISEMGPLLLSRLMGLNDTQRGVLSVVFKIADEQDMLLLDLKDFKAMLKYVGDNASSFTAEYGFLSKQSIGTIQRQLTMLEGQGADRFFGEPALDINDFLKLDVSGRGVVNVLDATKLFQSPDLYATMLLFILNELFEKLPEVGDIAKPKIVFFFDEAHLLFNNAPKALNDSIVQLVKLVRSKGVGVFFITQSPMDLPGEVLTQLSNRIQHALRAYTPADQKQVKAAADNFRVNPTFNVADVVTQLAVGEALISFMDTQGVPEIVQRALILPPQSLMGTVDAQVKQQLATQSILSSKYETPIDRESAYERLQQKYQDDQMAAQQVAAAVSAQKAQAERDKQNQKIHQQQQRDAQRAHQNTMKALNRMAGGAINAVGREVVREVKNPLLRGVLGSLVGRRRY